MVLARNTAAEAISEAVLKTIVDMRRANFTYMEIAQRLGVGPARVYEVVDKRRFYNMPKKVLIALPPAMLAEVDSIALNEHRTRSDLIREALRQYIGRYNDRVAARMVPVPRPVVTLVEGGAAD